MYEYKVKGYSRFDSVGTFEKFLNHYGKEGWRLVDIERFNGDAKTVVFMREKSEDDSSFSGYKGPK